MDVRVGKLDACVGNFWVTPERLSIIAFSQPFGQDRMYLVAPKEPVPDGFAGACPCFVCANAIDRAHFVLVC